MLRRCKAWRNTKSNIEFFRRYLISHPDVDAGYEDGINCIVHFSGVALPCTLLGRSVTMSTIGEKEIMIDKAEKRGIGYFKMQMRTVVPLLHSRVTVAN